MISEKFMWGAAMAANQCEGAYLEEGKGLSIVDLLPDAAHGRWDMLPSAGPGFSLMEMTANLMRKDWNSMTGCLRSADG